MPDSAARMQAQPDENRTAVLLDALGTLVSLQSPAPLLRAELGERFGVEVALQDAERAIAAEIEFYRAHLDQGRDPAGLAALRSSCAEVIREALPKDPSLAAVDNAALTAALLRSLRFRAFADVHPALSRWRGQGLRLVVLSNWDISLHDVLRRLGIAPLLDGILTSAQAGARKPAREIFEQALRLAGARASDAIHVGDSLDEDVAGARAAGVEPVLLDRDGRRQAPSGVRAIASLTELAITPGP